MKLHKLENPRNIAAVNFFLWGGNKINILMLKFPFLTPLFALFKT